MFIVPPTCQPSIRAATLLALVLVALIPINARAQRPLAVVIPKGKLIVSSHSHACGTAAGDTVEVSVSLDATIEAVDMGGFDFLYDSNRLEYAGFRQGSLTDVWPFFNAVNWGDFVRVGGFTNIAIPAGMSGEFVILRFVPHCCESASNVELCLTTLVSDFFGMSTACGSIQCVTLSTQPSSWGYVKSLYR
jgi:hypothetical protein